LSSQAQVEFAHPLIAPQHVDAVYTFVDHTEPEWRSAFQAYMNNRPDLSAADIFNRYRNWDELRFSIRSLHTNAPWIRHIYLVVSSPQQVPAWLNTSVVRVVYHHQLFDDPANQLPTFNSLAIESVLHRIKGLSNHFLYMNNDIFFGRESTVHDFISDNSYNRCVSSSTCFIL
jgi:hypothetical protein